MIKKYITEMTKEEARRFFLNAKRYCSLNLPVYADFQEILDKISSAWDDYECHICGKNGKVDNVEGKDDTNYLISPYPAKLTDVNHSLFSSKDGLYDWRKFQIIHPFVYVALVKTMTEQDNWEQILKRLSKFKNANMDCCSIPFQTVNDNSLYGDNILNWWTEIEQRSLKLSMEYAYMLNTDIVNCYGSIYTHSIAWAIHTKEVCKENQSKPQNERELLIGDKIDSILRWSTYGETCGIPQGSVLMDFIAELIL